MKCQFAAYLPTYLTELNSPFDARLYTLRKKKKKASCHGRFSIRKLAHEDSYLTSEKQGLTLAWPKQRIYSGISTKDKTFSNTLCAKVVFCSIMYCEFSELMQCASVCLEAKPASSFLYRNPLFYV